MSTLVVSSRQPRKRSVHDPSRAVQRQVEAQSDMEIISAVLSGEAHAFRDLVRRYERDVYRTTFYLLKNESDAEDAAQEAFIRAYRNLASFRAEAKFSTWLLSIALNEARDRIRRRKARRIVDLEEISRSNFRSGGSGSTQDSIGSFGAGRIALCAAACHRKPPEDLPGGRSVADHRGA